MCKFYIETSDLDNAITAITSGERREIGRQGDAIQRLNSEELDNAVGFAIERGFGHTEEKQILHVITFGILIGLKLAESQLALDTDPAGNFATAYDVA